MSEMVGRVAQAIWELGAANDISRGDAELLARVAIDAMRHPTVSMAVAGDQRCYSADMWPIMIDTALADE